MFSRISTAYLLDKNVTSSIERIFDFYKKEFGETYDKYLGFSKKRLEFLANKEWDSVGDRKNYEQIIYVYNKLKSIDKSNVKLYPFFCAIEYLYRNVEWDKENRVTNLDISEVEVQEVLSRELALLNRFFKRANVGDLSSAKIYFLRFIKERRDLLSEQDKSIDSILHIHQLIVELSEDGKISEENKKIICGEVEKNFNYPNGKLHKLLINKMLDEDKDAIKITKLRQKKFQVYNYFFDTFFICVFLNLRREMLELTKNVNNFRRELTYNNKISYITFDQSLDKFMNDCLNEIKEF